MNSRILTSLSIALLGIFAPLKDTYARNGRLAPADFNKMYHLATKGQTGILRNAVNRGLNIDSTNPNGDTGLCIAIKHKDYIAYNSFRMSGANPRHPCTYKIYKEYQEFLNTTKTVREEKILGNEESLYYNEKDKKLWPWILGGAIVGGGVLAFSGSGSGGSSSSNNANNDQYITPLPTGIGLTGYISNYQNYIDKGNQTNLLDYTYNNDTLTDPNLIELMPNTLDMYTYLNTFLKVTDGSSYENWGTITLGDGTVGISGYKSNTSIKNLGTLDVTATNGSIGMAVSNGATAYNGSKDLSFEDNGNIFITFKGATEGNALIGMYADTNSKIVNYGKITGTTAQTESNTENENNTENKKETTLKDTIIKFYAEDTSLDEDGDNSDNNDDSSDTANSDQDDETDDEDKDTTIQQSNTGSILGMGLFNFYTGTNLSSHTVSADNYGLIDLSAGYNNGSNIGVSLIGMGSYLDDNFLNKNNNPAYAEKMQLNNLGTISLNYQGQYKIAKDALKLGNGGLIGMRADAQTTATNTGAININLTSTNFDRITDVAAAMLSVHGAELINGDSKDIYNQTQATPSGSIKIINDATSGGISYAMLAAKGSGSQTRVYNWKAPKLSNYGLIDINVSNSYAMSSFDGGEVTNYGVINLGIENGHSYYTNNIGLYSEGKDLTDAADLINKGIINVNSVQSVAMQQMFSGSVDMINDGVIYLSQKATGSTAFAGNYSQGINNGTIFYKVDNSENFVYPTFLPDDPYYWILDKGPVGSVASISTDGNITKQDFINNGTIILSDEKSSNYNGTYGTAALLVSGQGSATNKEYKLNDDGTEEGLIWLKKTEPTYSQMNIGLYIDSQAKRAAFADNYGKIIIDSNYSYGVLNKSIYGATSFNYGDIFVNGANSIGMAGGAGSTIYNGSTTNSNANIYVNGPGAIGMYIKNSTMYNYGNIYASHGELFVLDGRSAVLNNFGILSVIGGNKDIVLFELINTGVGKNPIDVDVIQYGYQDGKLNIDGYTFLKISTGSDSSYVGLLYNTADVKNKYSRLLWVDGSGSIGEMAAPLNVSNEAIGAEATNGGEIRTSATLNVSDSGSIGYKISGNSSSVTTETGSYINVKNNATGIFSESESIVNNFSTINVEDGIGITSTSKLKEGGITVNLSEDSNILVTKGVGVNGIEVQNDGNIQLTSQTICSSIMCGYNNYTKGMITIGKDSQNNNNIIGNSMNYANMGVSALGGTFSNNEDAKISSHNIGVYLTAELNNTGNITQNYIGAYSIGGTIINEGNISNNAYGIYQLNGTTTNNGTIRDNTYGIYALGGYVDNYGTIYVGSGSTAGAYLKNATMTNYATIETGSATGVDVDANGKFNNNGTINVGSGIGIHVRQNGEATNTSTGTITVSGSGYGAYIENGGKFDNSGIIIYNSELGGNATNNGDIGSVKDLGATETSSLSSNLIKMDDNATLINHGTIEITNQDIDFNSITNNNSKIIIAQGGTFKGASFIGDVIASSDIIGEDFKDTYQNTSSFIGKNNGINVTSQSYMFNATTSTTNDNTDVILNRKNFEDIVPQKDLAEFLELNYNDKRGKNIFNALKKAQTKQEFDTITDEETGKNFYALLPRENMAIIRNITSNEQNRILTDGLNGVSVGTRYFKTGKDETKNLSGYDDDVYTAYISNGIRKNKNLSYGFSLLGAYADSSYDEANSSKQNQIIMAFAPILYQKNNLKYLSMPNFGVGFGEYKRHTSYNSYTADTFDIYYGLTNNFEYSIDIKLAELVAEAELNLQGISSDSAKEKGGLTLKSNNTLSLESGIGLKLRKKLTIAKEKYLTLEVGSKYYHEFLDPYKKLEATLPGSPLNFNTGHYDETKDRIKTTLGATYQDKALSLSAELSHNTEEQNNIEGGVGVRYNF